MIRSRQHHVSEKAAARHAADAELAARFGELLDAARAAEQAFRLAQATGAPLRETHRLTGIPPVPRSYAA